MSDQIDTKAGKIFSALPAIMAEVGAIGKNGKNTGQGGGYKFRAVDDVMAGIQPVFAKHGVTVYPVVKQYHSEQVAVGKNETRMFHVTALIEYHFAADDGSEIVAATLGEATDSGDKAGNKAMAAAYKYAITQTLSIPTNEIKDTEHTDPEHGDRELSPQQPTGWGDAPEGF